MQQPISLARPMRGDGKAAPNDLAELYGELADQLRQIVRISIRAPDALIDDACQIAWSRLLCSGGTVRCEKALPWLVTTATRVALRLAKRSARELSLDELCDLHGEPKHPAPVALEELVELRARLEEIRRLPKRQQRLVWLQGLGYTYTELADHTGDSRRTVERQLMRAKRALRSP
jgi:RNA polymerase sigma factor (sigma-70 family)